MTVNSIVSANQLPSSAAATGTGQGLGKNDFLNLMVTQLKHQDPLNPMDNQAMLSQMAQFSSLEQMSNLNSTMTSSSNVSAFMFATQFLGKSVDVVDPNTGSTVTSTVDSVSFSSQGPLLKLHNGSETSVQNITNVKMAS